VINQVWRRFQLLFAQGVGVMTSHRKVQVTILDSDDDIPPNIDRVEPYGFSYRPPRKGFQAYMAFPAGDRSYGMALIIGDRRYQMELAEGEVALHDDEGNYVHLQRGGTIKVKASTKVLADTPLFETTHDCKIGGNLLVLGTTHLQQVVNCDANVIVSGNVVAAMVLAGGYSSLMGGSAYMPQGMAIIGTFTVNGKNVGDTHTHNTAGLGAPTLGVN
jgi:phage gp45-like